MLDHGQSNRYFNFIPGVQGTWHALSHYKNASGKTEDDDASRRGALPRRSSGCTLRSSGGTTGRWPTCSAASRRSGSPDGRTLLDNSMIVYGATLGDGNEHDPDDLPALLAGGGGGTIRSGRALDFAEPTDLANLHLSLLQRMGVPADRFGNSATPMHEIDA